MTFAAVFLILGSLMAADEVKAAPLIYSLPEDGAWATFQVAVDWDAKSVPLSLTARSVGQFLHDNKPYRCIELEMVVPDGPHQIIIYPVENVTWRLMIPEDQFGDGKNPIASAVKCWRKIGENEPVLEASLAAADPLFASILKGPEGKLKREDATEKIQWQNGNLDCQVFTGRQEMEFVGVMVEISSRILRHNEVPFSTAGVRKELKATAAGTDYQVNISATLRDFGQDAKPKLPHLVP